MTTIKVRSLSLATVAALAVATSTAAQESAILNAIEVPQLVDRAEPGDHARLSAHFAALAERYAAEAKRHTLMSRNFASNPNRGLATGMSLHCTRLAQLGTQSTTTVRELAAYHQTRARGATAALPPDGARFQGGTGALAPTERERSALAANARTAADHRALQEYFGTLSRRYTASAGEHVALAQSYRGTRIAQAAVHHDLLAKLAREAAKEATEAAATHEQLAGLPRSGER